MGSGTALPGLIAEKLAPNLFSHFADQLQTTILITGTNGKSTTRSLLENILLENKFEYISNKEGSNMKRGLLSTFLKHSNFLGKLPAKTAILEVEEATLPQIISKLNPNILIVTNIFRDQLDAYGEVDKTQNYIRQAIEAKPEMKLVLNSDDLLTREVATELPNQTYFFSIESKERAKFDYEGSIRGKNKPENYLLAKNIEIDEKLNTNFELNLINYCLPIPGVFHVYNALAAIQTAKLLNISQKNIQQAFKTFKPAFGRGELIKHKFENSNVVNFKLLLIKNPAGFSLTLDMLKNLKKPKILIIINDNIADGRDVSWLWDSNVQLLNQINPEKLFVSGTRALDMALRIKYSQRNISNFQSKDLVIHEDTKTILEQIKSDTKKNETIFVLPTYTAMNEFRNLLGKNF